MWNRKFGRTADHRRAMLRNMATSVIAHGSIETTEMKAKDLKTQSIEELNNQLKTLKEELFNLRFQLAINQLDKPHKITEVKHDIARVMTVLREKNA